MHSCLIRKNCLATGAVRRFASRNTSMIVAMTRKIKQMVPPRASDDTVVPTGGGRDLTFHDCGNYTWTSNQ